jgi:hypothetical protein
MLINNIYISTRDNPHPIYNVWRSMKKRCSLPSRRDYKDYGGRGIQVCERWMSSRNFIKDMLSTWKPGLTIERIDNNKGYYPENCRWATQKEQANNRRNNRYLTLNGETKTLFDWSKELNIPISTLFNRLDRGWSDEDTLTKSRKVKTLTYNGVTKTISQWIKDLGISKTTLYHRLERGWSVEDSLADIRKAKTLTYNNITKSLIQWAKDMNISYHVLYSRINTCNWSVEKSLTTPVR